MRRFALLAPFAVGAACAATYTTYIADSFEYRVTAIAADASGNSYVTGGRITLAFATGSPQTDVFVGKLDASGNLSILGTYSGKGSDQAESVAVDPSGNIYIVGATSSPDFPLLNPLQTVPYSGPAAGGTGFLMKLAPSGALIYSTFLGGTLGPSQLNGVAADAAGNAYVTGTTGASDYPRTAGLPAGEVTSIGEPAGASGAFFAKIDPSGSQILYAGALVGPTPGCENGGTPGSSCFLTPTYSSGAAIAVDPAGSAYIAGNNDGMGLPTTSGALVPNGIGAFVAKVNAAGTGMVYVTYLGEGDLQPEVGTVATDIANAIAVDAEGNAYVSGSTADPSFPVTTGSFQTTLSNAATPPSVGPSDAFVAKLNPTGTAMVWATYLGGTQPDAAQTIAVDSSGDVWVSGTTQSADFPTTVSVTPGGNEFLTEFNSIGSKLIYSAMLPTYTVAQALSADAAGNIHTAGNTGLVSAFGASAPPGETSAPWTFGLINAAGGLLLGRVAPGELIAIYGLNIGPAQPAYASFNSSGFLPTTLGGTQVAFNGVAAALLYVSATQINAIAPIELTAGSAGKMQLTVMGSPLTDFRVMVDAASPGVFRSPQGGAAAINQDGTINSASNPAPDGSYISVWATGTGYFPGQDGQMATAANQFCTPGLLFCVVFENGGLPDATNTPVTVTYSGAAPDLVNGVVQVNFQVSASAQFGYFLSVNGIDSTVFTIYTAPSQ